MDTILTQHPDIEHDDRPLRARLPDEGDEPSHQHEEPGLPFAAPEAGDGSLIKRLSTVSGGRRAALLGTGAAFFILGGAYLFTSHKHVRPPQLATSIGNASARPVLAPSANLAGVNVPVQQPVVMPHYSPKPREQEVDELLALQGGAKAPLPSAADQHRSAPSVHPPLILGSQTPVPVPDPASPPHLAVHAAPAAGGVPLLLAAREPGAQPVAAPVTSPANLAPPLKVPVADPTVRPVQQPASSEPGAVATVAPEQEQQTEEKLDAQKAAAPNAMALPDESKVLGMITQLGYAMRDMEKRNNQLRSDLVRLSAATADHLQDDERRIGLVEAGRSVTAAIDVAGSAEPRASSRPMTRSIGLYATPASAAPKIYHVQAASPGLAMLAEVDRGGGEGAQFETKVGDEVPGYGMVRSIAQRGTAWVVLTDRGQIQ